MRIRRKESISTQGDEVADGWKSFDFNNTIHSTEGEKEDPERKSSIQSLSNSSASSIPTSFNIVNLLEENRDS